MVTISRANLGDQLPFYIRDLLRNNLTRPSGASVNEWIFKSNPEIEWKTEDFPIVIIDTDMQSTSTINMEGSKNAPDEFSVRIMVYHINQHERDTIADQIQATLLDFSKVDLGGDNMRTNRIKPVSVSQATKDSPIHYPKILRIKEVIFRCMYYGG